MFGNLRGLFGTTPALYTQNVQQIVPQSGAAIQHPVAPVGGHQMRPVQEGGGSFFNRRPPSPALSGPQGVHNFTPQGQQFANQQALAAEQKRLADALRAQQEAEAAAQAQASNGAGSEGNGMMMAG